METIIGESGGASGGVSGGSEGDLIKDSDTKGFQADVMEASLTTPVIVDFWAPWCGPCKQIGPALEREVRAARGKVRLVKINVDENPQIAQSFRVQSIPAVFAVDKGRPVDSFTGAVPDSQIKSFVAKLTAGAPASPVEQALEQARAALGQEDFAAAGALFAQIVEHEPDNVDAIAGQARCLIATGELAAAREILDGPGAAHAEHVEITGARAALDLAEEGAEMARELVPLEDKLARNANDHQARFDIAKARYAMGEREVAVEHLLEIIRRDRNWDDAAARKKLVTLFEAFGPTDPLTLSARRQLSSLLFS